PIFEQKSIQNIPSSTEDLIVFVQELYNNSKFREGVYIASQELYSEWEKAVKNNTLNESLSFSILKYYIRSFSSAVPFGLFSSHGINTNEKAEQSRYTYLDTVILYAFLRKINKEDIIRKSVLRLNDTIYEVGNQYRYIETIITSGNVSYN
ncbi:lantibiotic dehydratase, partial [Paraburkholderia sp. SIMBA_027]